jgi:hypothetical protein
MFAAVISVAVARGAAAQNVPGRDLLQFPIGLLADAAPLSRELPGGLWNPAAAVLTGRDRWAFGVAALATPIQQDVEASVLGGAFVLRPHFTGSVSLAQSSVGDILKTETDPQSLGGEIPYSTTVISIGSAVALPYGSAGLAARYRFGSLDTDRGGSFSVDGGVVLDRVARTPLRVAASTFLFSPWGHGDATTYLLGIDAPLIPGDSVRSLRAGYSIQHTDQRGHEGYVFMSAHYGPLDGSAGLLDSDVFGQSTHRVRIGLGLRYHRYHVAVAREDGAAGVGASRQFLLTSVFP